MAHFRGGVSATWGCFPAGETGSVMDSARSLAGTPGMRDAAPASHAMKRLENEVVAADSRGPRQNIARARSSASTSTSTSPIVLYRPKDTRAVAGTPKNCITGIAQWWPVRKATP